MMLQRSKDGEPLCPECSRALLKPAAGSMTSFGEEISDKEPYTGDVTVRCLCGGMFLVSANAWNAASPSTLEMEQSARNLRADVAAANIRALKAGVDPDIIVKISLEYAASLSSMRQTRAQFLEWCGEICDKEFNS